MRHIFGNMFTITPQLTSSYISMSAYFFFFLIFKPKKKFSNQMKHITYNKLNFL